MAEHTFDDEGMSGYFLPEDSQLLLKQLSGHIRFLARLAQPRVPEEVEEWAPTLGLPDLMFCLDQLAEQLEAVIGALSWPAWRGRVPGTDEPEQTAAPTADLPRFSKSVYAGESSFAFGVTVDQIDSLNRFVSAIRAYGDVISAGSVGVFAAETLPSLGNAIFEGVDEVCRLLSEVEAQALEGTGRPSSSICERSPSYRTSTSVVMSVIFRDHFH